MNSDFAFRSLAAFFIASIYQIVKCTCIYYMGCSACSKSPQVDDIRQKASSILHNSDFIGYEWVSHGTFLAVKESVRGWTIESASLDTSNPMGHPLAQRVTIQDAWHILANSLRLSPKHDLAALKYKAQKSSSWIIGLIDLGSNTSLVEAPADNDEYDSGGGLSLCFVTGRRAFLQIGTHRRTGQLGIWRTGFGLLGGIKTGHVMKLENGTILPSVNNGNLGILEATDSAITLISVFRDGLIIVSRVSMTETSVSRPEPILKFHVSPAVSCLNFDGGSRRLLLASVKKVVRKLASDAQKAVVDSVVDITAVDLNSLSEWAVARLDCAESGFSFDVATAMDLDVKEACPKAFGIANSVRSCVAGHALSFVSDGVLYRMSIKEPHRNKL